MSDIFEIVPHPRHEQRKIEGAPKVAAAVAQMHGPGPIGRFNAKFGLKITVIVGTMWCAYLFTLLALVSAPSAFRSGNSLIIIAWIAQTFLQLVLLPIIIVGQNVQAAAADATTRPPRRCRCRARGGRQIQAHLAAQDDAIGSILSALSRGAAPAAPGGAPAS